MTGRSRLSVAERQMALLAARPPRIDGAGDGQAEQSASLLAELTGQRDSTAEAFDPLEQELFAASLALPGSAIDLLRGLAVPAEFLFALTGAGDLGLAMVSLEDRGARWSPEGPDRRLLLAVRENGALVDIVALASGCRDEWACRTGEGTLLGWDRWLDCQSGLAPGHQRRLHLFATPIDWLAGGGQGICVLEWSAAACGMLRGLGPDAVLTCSAAAKDNLRAMLAYGGLPRIEAATAARRAA